MKTFKEKFRYTFLPFICVTFITTLVFDAVYYFLVVVPQPDYSEQVTTFVIPACFAAVVQLIVMLPFINKFTLAPRQNRFGINFVSFMLLCAPLMISGPLIRKLSAEVIPVNEVSEINPASKDYCFTVKDFSIDTGRVGEEYWTERHHRKNRGDYTQLNLILAAPVKNKEGNNYNSTYWLCRDYSHDEKHINVPAGDYDNFMARSRNGFKSAGTVKDIKYLEKISARQTGSHTLGAINDIMYRAQATKFVVLKPHYKSLADETALQAFFLFLAFFITILFWGLISWQFALKKQPAKQNWVSRRG